MDKKIKYRQYVIDNGRLVKIILLSKLPDNARKDIVGLDVWITPSYYNVWSKICRIDNEVTFGTGKTEPGWYS